MTDDGNAYGTLSGETPAAQQLSGLDVTGGGREPWGPERADWGDPPLSPETVHRIAQRARYFRRLFHGRLSAANAARIVDLLVADVELLVADHDSYDVVDAP